MYQAWVHGVGAGHLVNPVSISADPNSEYLYVAHGGDKRIEVFDKHGKYIESWGLAGVGNGQLKRAVSVTFGNDNRVYVTDKDKSVIDIFSIVPHADPLAVQEDNNRDNIYSSSTKNAKSGNPSQSKEYTLLISFNDFDHSGIKEKQLLL